MQDFVGYLLSFLNKNVDQGKALTIFALMMARMIVIVNLVPFLGAKNAPAPVKMGIGILLTVLLWPVVAANLTGPLPSGAVHFALLMLKEVFVGFAIGFVTAEIFYVVEMTGQFVDTVRGANQIQLMIPELQERSSAFGDLNYQLMLVLFMAADLHVLFFHGLLDSFIAVPVNAWPPMSAGSAAFFEQFTHLLSEIFLIAVTLAMPVGVVCLVIDVGFGLMNRVAPQINAYFMSMPAKALGGVMISFAALSMTISQFGHFSTKMIQHLIDGIQLLK
jgi:flagellar biosynthetic protein FliR